MRTKQVVAADVQPGQKFMYAGRILIMATEAEAREHPSRDLVNTYVRRGAAPPLMCWCHDRQPASILPLEGVLVRTKGE